MMEYKIVFHRNGTREEIDDFDTLEEAVEFGKTGREMGEFFFEYVLDENDIICFDGIDDVIGVERGSEVIGTQYKRGKGG